MSERLSSERQDLVRHVFADATCMLEMAHAFASTGQGSELSAAEYRQCANRLESVARNVVILAAALPLLICPSIENDGESR